MPVFVSEFSGNADSSPSFFEYKRQGGVHSVQGCESLDFSDVDNQVASLKYKGPKETAGLFGYDLFLALCSSLFTFCEHCFQDGHLKGSVFLRRVTGPTAVKFAVTIFIGVLTGALAVGLETINERLFKFKNSITHNLIRSEIDEEGLATLHAIMKGAGFHTCWTLALVLLSASLVGVKSLPASIWRTLS